MSVPTLSRHDPLKGFKFRIDLNLTGTTAGFSKCTGLEEEFEIVEYREGHDPQVKRKYPGLSTFPNLVLEHGLSTDETIIKWFRECNDTEKDAQKSLTSTSWQANGLKEMDYRRNITIYIYDKAATEPTITWKVKNAFPAKLTHGELNAMGSDIVLETLEIAHEGLFRVASAVAQTPSVRTPNGNNFF